MDFESSFDDHLQDAEARRDAELERIKELRSDPDKLKKLALHLQQAGHPAADELDEDLKTMIHWMDNLGMPIESMDGYHNELLQAIKEYRSKSLGPLLNNVEILKKNPDIPFIIIPAWTMLFAFFTLGLVDQDEIRSHLWIALAIINALILTAALKKRRIPLRKEEIED